MSTRRHLLLAGTCTATALAAGLFTRRLSAAPTGEVFEVSFTETQWRAKLTPQQFAILRQAGTERPFTSLLNEEHRNGTFSCAGCALPLFSSKTKYDSGTGWPSFWKPLDKAVGEHQDRDFGMLRTEVHCRRCGGHLGHVFDDGPKPTGLRYCMNGFAMSFAPQTS